MTAKNLRDEITELAEAVRELRDREVAAELAGLRAEVEKLRAERATHHCIGCTCGHVCIHYGTQLFGGTVTYPNTWTVTSGGSGVVTATNGYPTGGNTTALTSN